MKTRQLFDKDTWTYTYVVWDEETREAAIIDSVKEKFKRDSHSTFTTKSPRTSQ